MIDINVVDILAKYVVYYYSLENLGSVSHLHKKSFMEEHELKNFFV